MEIYHQIAELLGQGKPFVLATLINTSGSVPRDVGAKMLVYPDGSIFGTIGGGAFEKMIIDDCLAMFKGETTTQLKNYLLQDSGPDALGMYCGGKADVFLERFSRPNTIYIFGGGHIGRDLAMIATGLNFRVVIVDDRP
jgi:xanthine dehydrogenase accessory factor